MQETFERMLVLCIRISDIFIAYSFSRKLSKVIQSMIQQYLRIVKKENFYNLALILSCTGSLF